MIPQRDRENYNIGYKDGYDDAIKHAKYNIECFIESNKRSWNPVSLIKVYVYRRVLKNLRKVK